MINKRLLRMVSDARKLVYCIVILRWVGLLCYVAMIFSIGFMLENISEGFPIWALAICAAAPFVRYFCTRKSADMAARSADKVKKTLRAKVYGKLLTVWPQGESPTAEILQISTEGCEQLEVYFSKYIPQFFTA